MVLGSWAGVLRRGLDAVDGLGGFGAACGLTGEDELLRGAVVGSAHEQVVEVEAGEQLGKDFAGLSGAVCAEDAVISGSALHFHAGLCGDGLKNLEQLGVAGFDGEFSVPEGDGGGGGRLVSKRGMGLRGCGLLRNRGRGFSGLCGEGGKRKEQKRGQGAERSEQAACRESVAGRCRMNGREFARVVHVCRVEVGLMPFPVY